ncbi:hypothetical protein MTO96_006183 [Rhipicephalus appendiculatus]
MEDLLEHYENDCAFHIIQCERGGHTIPRKSTVAHYLSGCGNSVSSSDSEHSASETTAVASADSSIMEEREEALSGDVFQDDVLAALQDQMTELTKRVRNQEDSLKKIIREQRQSARTLRDEMTERITSAISACLPKQLNPGKPADDDPTSSALSLESEKAVILRKLEHFANVTLSTLEELRQNMLQISHDAVIARCEPVPPCRDRLRHLTKVQTTNPQLGAEIPSVTYCLTLKNADIIFSSGQEDRTLAEVTTWHMRDTYFVVTVRKYVRKNAERLALDIEFNDLREGSQWFPSAPSVCAVNPNGKNWDFREDTDTPCASQYVNDCKRFFLKTPAGRIPIGCTFYCTTDKGGAMGVAGTECVNTTLIAAAKMAEDVQYICKLGVCNHRLTCEHSGLSIGCRRKDFIPPKGYYPYYGKNI